MHRKYLPLMLTAFRREGYGMKHRLDEKQGESLNGLLEAILSLRDKEECRAFLMDLCTIQELIGMSQRLQVAKLLLKGETYDAIRQSLPVSSSTITRVNTALQFGPGGYRSVLNRMGGEG